MSNSKWTQAQALVWAAEKWPIAKALGWYIGLTGSTLYDSVSTKDIDIILYKHRGGSDPSPFKQVMETICEGPVEAAYVRHLRENFDGAKPSDVTASAQELVRDTQPISEMQVFVGEWRGKRIDFFIFGEPVEAT